MSCSFSSSDSTCGPTAYAPEDASIIPLRACRKDLSGYLTSLGVSGCRGIGTSNILAEYELILNRAGFYNLSREDTEKMTICPKHRYELSTHFQQLPPRCSYPIHRGEKKSLKNPRRVNKKVSEEMFSLYHVKVPTGSGTYNPSLRLCLLLLCFNVCVFLSFEINKLCTLRYCDKLYK